MQTDMQTHSFKHDAFISYSRKNTEFAIKLQKALESYKPPKGMNLPQRHLDVFRDIEDLGAGDYDQAIESGLTQSAKLIVLCSPDSRASKFVNDEIREFAKLRGVEHIIPVLIKGIPNNEYQSRQEDNRAFPDALCDLIRMPLAARYVDFDPKKDKVNKGRFEQPWFDVLASMYSNLPDQKILPGEIARRDAKRAARTRNLWIGASTAIISILTIALTFALFSWQQAAEARSEALRQRDEADEARKSEKEQRKKAEESADEAKRQQGIAEAQRKIAITQRDLAIYRERLNRQYYYAASMNLAAQEFENENWGRGRELLNQFLPKNKLLRTDDIRDFYWYYLRRANPQEFITLKRNNDITSITFSPDGKKVAFASGGINPQNSFELWDLGLQKSISTMKTQQTNICSRTITNKVTFSPDGKLLASADAELGDDPQEGDSDGNSVRLWDVASQKEVMRLGHEKSVKDVAFSPDGKVLLSASGNNIEIWQIDTENKELKELGFRDVAVSVIVPDHEGNKLKGHEEAVTSIALSPDGKMIASASVDKTVKLWDMATRQNIATLCGHESPVISVTFSPHGKILASSGNDGTVKVWDIGLRQNIATIHDRNAPVNAVAFSPDGKLLASADGWIIDSNPAIKLWDTSSWSNIATLKGHNKRVLSINFSPDGKTLASAGGSLDGEVKLWNISSLSKNAVFTEENSYYYPGSVTFSPDSKELVWVSSNRAIKFLDIASQSHIKAFPDHKSPIKEVSFLIDGKKLASFSEGYGNQKESTLWDVATGQTITTVTGPKVSLSTVDFTPDGMTFASVQRAKIDKFWKGLFGKTRLILPGAKIETRIFAKAISQDGETLALAGQDTILLFNRTSKLPIALLKGHLGPIWSIAFSPDGKTLASGGDDETVKLWDVRSGQVLTTLKGHKQSVLSVSFSPDGKTLVSASSNERQGEIRFWFAARDSEVARQCIRCNSK